MFLLLLLFVLFSWSVQARAVVALAEGEVSRAVAEQLRFVADEERTLDLAGVLALPAERWQQNGDQVFSHGYTQANWWLRLEVGNPGARPARQLLELAYPVLDDVEVWVLGADQRPEAHYRLGDKQPFAQRPLQHRFFLVPLDLPSGSERTVILRLRSSSSMQAPLALWNERAYFEQDQKFLMAEGLFFGGIGLLVVYSFFVFVALRERVYFYYVVFVFSLLAFLASLKGFSFQFLWPQATDWNDRVLMVSLSTMLLSGGLFTYRFLGISAASGWLYRMAATLIMLMAGFLVLSFFMDYASLMRPLIVVAALGCLLLLVIGAWRWRQGDHAARFYTTAWGAMLSGGVILALNKFELLPQNFFTENAMQIGVAVEVVLLSFAIVDRINEDRRRQYLEQIAESSQSLADIIGVPVDRPRITETTALGAAFLAGLHVGVFASLDEIAALWHCDRRFAPLMANERRSQLYAGWLDAVRRARALHPAPIIAVKAEILFFTGIRRERLDPQASWTRVELPAAAWAAILVALIAQV